MKVILVLFVIGGLGLAAVYFTGGYGSFDPTQQGEEAKAAMTVGMTWKQVINAGGEPSKYQHIGLKRKKIGKEWTEVVVVGTPVKFDRAKFDQRIANNGTPQGFVFGYRFSEQVAFDVSFDSTGKVTGIADAMTMADLLQTR